ncbi:MAG: phosphatase PAP2 family protein [Longimicrobiales bacterium]
MQADTTDRIVGNPLHRIWAMYAFIAGFAVLFPNHPSTWPALLMMHLMIIALYWPITPFKQGWNFFTQRWPKPMRIIFDWLPLLLVPALYEELAPLNLMVHGGRYFDSIILSIEHSVFGMPSQDLAANFPKLWLSELLHSGYLSYYFIIFIPPLILYLMGRTRDYRRAVFTILLSFFMHYLFFIYFPVQGPRYLFPAPSGEIARGSMYQLTHKLLEAGSSRGAAFPSSHVGVAVTQSLIMMRYMPKLSIFLVVLTILLANGAVYGGFHYATDAFFGLVLGTIAVLIAPRVYNLLGGTWGRAY